MEIVRPMSPVLGPANGIGPVVPPDDAPASAPRPDVPPVARGEGPAPAAPRPPDQMRLGLVQAGLLAGPAPVRDHAPERVLKPWGVAMLPDSERAEERRAKQADVIAEQTRALPAPTPGAPAPDGHEAASADTRPIATTPSAEPVPTRLFPARAAPDATAPAPPPATDASAPPPG